jgi:F-type H+-transporting ATPase subunit b
MLIDWFTVGAQALNFLILAWLLKRFLYNPILGAIDAREKRIAAELADADAKRTAAQKEREEFQTKNKAFDEQRAALLAKAVDEAKADRDRLMGEARKDADALRAAQSDALRSDRKRLGDEISRLAQDEVFAITRKALGDLASASLEERMGEVFTRRLREMDGKAKDALAAAIRGSSDPAFVRSTFDMGDTQKAAIQNALNECFSAEVRVRFETAPEGLCGVELSAGGQKVAWSISDYLSVLDRKVDGLLDDQAARASAPPPQAGPEPAAALHAAA